MLFDAKNPQSKIFTVPLRQGRVVDPVHFRPDPDPANKNLINRILILLALIKNEFKYLNHVILIRFNHIFNLLIFYFKIGFASLL